MSTTTAIMSNETSKPMVNPWLIGVVVSLAAFMEVLDTSIANVALPHIAGNLGASNSESTWVLTSYLVANAIVLPIGGFLVSTFGRKRFFLFSIVMFTLSSFLCGIAPSLGALLFFRVLQGAFGGGLQPMAQAIIADAFPPEERGLAFALYGVTAVVAPALGPTLGGWITENYSWRWIFYINIPIGLVASFLVYQLLQDPPYLARTKKSGKMDYFGFAFLAIGVGALQILLDKGQEDDWFSSRFIITLFVLTVVGLVSLVIWEWRHKDPIVDVRLFKNFNFAGTNIMFFILGVILMSGSVLLPQLLQTLMGYTAQKAGEVLSVSAIVVLVTMPLIGKLSTIFQARYLMAFGWLSLAVGLYISAYRMDLLASYNVAVWLRILQFWPVGFLFIPMTMVGYLGLPEEKTNAASGLMNFMRNIGMSVGTSIVTTLLARRGQYHQSILAEHTSSGRFNAAVEGLSHRLMEMGLSAQQAHQQAVARMYQQIVIQAQALSYLDIYWLSAVAAALMLLGSFALKKNEPGKGAAVVVH